MLHEPTPTPRQLAILRVIFAHGGEQEAIPDAKALGECLKLNWIRAADGGYAMTLEGNVILANAS